jgi:hypothetical protein
MTDTCTNIEYNSCSSVERGEVPDMRLGDTCILCCCWECERCDETIDLDCEIQVNDFVAGAHNLGDPASAGYIAVCEKCVTKEDTLYDN